MFDMLHNFCLLIIKLTLKICEELRNLHSYVLSDHLRLYSLKHLLDFFEFVIILFKSVVDVASFHGNKLRILMLSIIYALLTTEITSLVIKCHKR